MIISLCGKITHKSNNFIILENAGIGYQIFFNDIDKVGLGEELGVFVHEYVREDKHDLYGFLNFEKLQFFLKLLSISGVGPKMAQNIVGLGIDKIQKSILEGDASLIQGIPGVGKKTAQKIVLELRGSIDKILEKSQVNQEVVSALTGLGYSRTEAEEVLRHVAGDISGTEAQLKAALKLLGR
ncbi:Holliday junction branch migration protein RuvA [Patescibacteria group bacterium]|nr:Holliday junction branch migration protein RuvA [Patescibacteria group bacterium]